MLLENIMFFLLEISYEARSSQFRHTDFLVQIHISARILLHGFCGVVTMCALGDYTWSGVVLVLLPDTSQAAVSSPTFISHILLF